MRYESPKLGNNDDYVDSIAVDLLDSFAFALKDRKNERKGVFRAGTGSAMYYLWHANEIGASPDGRLAGEPLMQPDFLLKLCEKLSGFDLCIETSGYTDEITFKNVINALDFIIMDIKIADSSLHKKYTGVTNDKILSNFEILKRSGKPYLIRTPLIPGITVTKENLDAILKIIGNSRWEQLPYNTMAGAKYKMLNMKQNVF